MQRKADIQRLFFMGAFCALAALCALALSGCTPLHKKAPGSSAQVELTVVVDNAPTYSEWSEAESLNYYRVLGSAHIDDIPDIGSAIYLPLDEMGRASRVVACVDFDMMEAGRERERGDMRLYLR